MNVKFRQVLPLICMAAVIACANGMAVAGEMGHHSPAAMGIRDYAMPPKGFYLMTYNTYYRADKYKNSSGETFKSLSLSQSVSSDVSLTRNLTIGGQSVPITVSRNVAAAVDLNVDIKPEVNVFMQTPALIWNPGWRIAGADYAFLVAPSWGHMRVDVNAHVDGDAKVSVGRFSRTLSANADVSFMDEKTGFGDLFIEPVWLDWRGDHYDLGLNYAIWAPTGAYDKDDFANVGYGFCTQRLQTNMFYYPFKNKSTAFMITPSYEWHTKKIDKDVQPGQVATVEYGISQYLHPRVEVGVMGYHQWQTTFDQGTAAAKTEIKDRINGLGAEISVWPIKERCAVTGKYSFEYGAKDRFDGMFWSLNVLWIF